MNAGALNHLIRLEQLGAPVQDPNTGELTQAWETFVDEIPASVAPSTGRELVAAGATQAEGTTSIGFWWFPGVTPAMRAIDIVEEVIYNIIAVLPDSVNGRTGITLVCTSGLTDGR